MKIRADPRGQRQPSFKNQFYIRTHRGQLILCAWPRKRGPSKSPAVRRQNAWFKGANLLAKVAEPTQQNLAIRLTQGTGLYPRDLLLKQMSGGIYELQDFILQPLEARKRFRLTVVFQGLILENDTPQTIPISTTTILTWPLPVFDTLGFWSAAAPTRITIPVGIEIVEFTAGWRGETNTLGGLQIPLLLKNGVEIARQEITYNGAPAAGLVRGAIPVIAGDFFEFALFLTKPNTTFGDEKTFFTLNVLQAA